MHRLLPIVPFLVVMFLFLDQGLGAIHSVGPTKTIRFEALPLAAGPPSMDFKKQDLRKIMPAAAAAKASPNLEPLIDQLVRHADLNSSAMKIMPWVYATTAESVVADYEDAVTSLDIADECLQEAIRKVLYGRVSIGVDPMVVHAASQMDHAEFTILLLFEIAKLEL